MTTKVVIIGAGPAGMATALQLKRYGINTLLFEKQESTSLLRNAWCVENYLGFPEGKSGLELLHQFQQHIQQHNITVITEEVQQLDYLDESNLFAIKTTAADYEAEYIVVASGTKPRTDPKLDKFFAGKIFYEISPLLAAKNKTIAIIGAGDAAFDFALNLASNNKILLLNKGTEIRALPLLIDKALQHPNITYKENYKLTQINVDFVLAGIGREPQKSFYSPSLVHYEKDLITEGRLYLAGDVDSDIYRQIAIATASGIYTAMKIYEQMRI